MQDRESERGQRIARRPQRRGSGVQGRADQRSAEVDRELRQMRLGHARRGLATLAVADIAGVRDGHRLEPDQRLGNGLGGSLQAGVHGRTVGRDAPGRDRRVVLAVARLVAPCSTWIAMGVEIPQPG